MKNESKIIELNLENQLCDTYARSRMYLLKSVFHRFSSSRLVSPLAPMGQGPEDYPLSSISDEMVVFGGCTWRDEEIVCLMEVW
ncbi:MAG: hypothetical protein A3G33_07535 [Omnitrophica bacterium RIFCSPLOWO2_12_FULL_44_17]|uniref:Uncharacterized protein n=1 Tax=Candidatus Danuiimicrobium aquiferis TaxID=1801832 RepID=A0A1G1KYW9_9BACT|nr:MAG: hypothetical protein A3B72_07835 [Omnitrophica bacterium RIFCSPHIGHO2_02_FULL_45_28]OGW92151.1 MAG: hypothetical protein A3E74_10305 [Omnitrophica bacterium RIFCSPHIGHO2_12_FULL_44_12]OGW98071.1 MAG: hypothetical protein A3G33_07535 [Omnitrophica bacterium RIFCSPLOWO2_12_FULL_44_17]OGX03487.1 MAG: hypothetical protein A3J12_02690 [Omnitrophica bacterium RIFCSPLOWO2_02_FULL_44_11]